jgi:hypothetical protein
VFAGLHLLGDFTSGDAVDELLGRDQEVWIEYFRKLGNQKLGNQKADNTTEETEELHEISLLRRLFESAGGKRDSRQHRLDVRWSANDNLLRLGRLLNLDFNTEPVLFGNLNAQKTREALMQSKIFERDELDVETLKAQILQYVPLGFSRVTLPAELSHGIPYGTIMGFEMRR